MRIRVLVWRSLVLPGDVQEYALWLIGVLARCADQKIVICLVQGYRLRI
jgi:hypothetical protein